MSRRALEFLVWREGTARDWDCTQEEIAKAVGYSVREVSRICAANGWKTIGGLWRRNYKLSKDERQANSPGEAAWHPVPVDRLMESK